MDDGAPKRAAWSENLARASRPLLLRLQAAPRVVLLVGVAAVLALGLFAPGIVGAFFLLLIGLFLLWLALLAWPLLDRGPRLLRVGTAVGVMGLGVAKALGLILT